MMFLPLVSLKEQFQRALAEQDIKPVLKLAIKFPALHNMKILEPLVDWIIKEKQDENDAMIKTLKEIVY